MSSSPRASVSGDTAKHYAHTNAAALLPCLDGVHHEALGRALVEFFCMNCAFLFPMRFFQRDGELVATGYESGDVRVWRPLETSCVASLSVSSTSVICTAFSCEGTYLAAACADGSVVVWQLRRDKTAECGEKVGAGREKDRSAAADSKSEETNGGGRDSEASNSAISFVKVHAYRHRGECDEVSERGGAEDLCRDDGSCAGSDLGCREPSVSNRVLCLPLRVEKRTHALSHRPVASKTQVCF